MPLLVVEDDDIVRLLIVEVLDEMGYTIVQAADATEALRVLEDDGQPLDLLMTDVGLPDMRGEDLAKQARKIRPSLPVLFASGYAESVDVPEGMHLIGKPFSIDQLRDKVMAILGAP
ncbi:MULTISPECIES: response regulator [Pseudomonas]|uniref:Response regulator n=1 Tax=Pseudomonas taiwanensis TaxID=470150 RepID=A0ABR6V2U5_9PSED|nr:MULTISPECIES: response regulator [Pseudomonas]AGZ35829.1 response regulator receiver protein [Pseudomonas sp. VLB120]AVD89681.1 response regulator [Pseudomonas sp. SWI44]MBC3474217.1 response regulator [Pseudomonas taiwanensis]MBC3491872.1 response regulator [Pseudomonas taiwanensis]MDT8924006.1 response regulator [Pseudomonas taiwanensis]